MITSPSQPHTGPDKKKRLHSRTVAGLGQQVPVRAGGHTCMYWTWFWTWKIKGSGILIWPREVYLSEGTSWCMAFIILARTREREFASTRLGRLPEGRRSWWSIQSKRNGRSVMPGWQKGLKPQRSGYSTVGLWCNSYSTTSSSVVWMIPIVLLWHVGKFPSLHTTAHHITLRLLVYFIK